MLNAYSCELYRFFFSLQFLIVVIVVIMCLKLYLHERKQKIVWYIFGYFDMHTKTQNKTVNVFVTQTHMQPRMWVIILITITITAIDNIDINIYTNTLINVINCFNMWKCLSFLGGWEYLFIFHYLKLEKKRKNEGRKMIKEKVNSIQISKTKVNKWCLFIWPNGSVFIVISPLRLFTFSIVVLSNSFTSFFFFFEFPLFNLNSVPFHWNLFTFLISSQI